MKVVQYEAAVLSHKFCCVDVIHVYKKAVRCVFRSIQLRESSHCFIKTYYAINDNKVHCCVMFESEILSSAYILPFYLQFMRDICCCNFGKIAHYSSYQGNWIRNLVWL